MGAAHVLATAADTPPMRKFTKKSCCMVLWEIAYDIEMKLQMVPQFRISQLTLIYDTPETLWRPSGTCWGKSRRSKDGIPGAP